MEIYVLDSFLQRSVVVDDFLSLVWTERYKDLGDFELNLLLANGLSTKDMTKVFKEDTMLINNISRRVMVVENIEKMNGDGKKQLKVTGKSLEKILMDRAAIKSMASGVAVEWSITDTPANICRIVFDTVCVDHEANLGDLIPFLEDESIFPPDSNPEPDNVITYVVPPEKSVYEVIKEICDIYDLGFRLVRNVDTGRLSFNIYSGSDVTSAQSSRPAVVFSRDLDNLTNTKEFTSVENQKNCAYVVHPETRLMVYALGFSDSTTIGFARKVMVVDASSSTKTGAPLLAEMQQFGEAELAKQRGLKAFDGEIKQAGGYIYGSDYNLGDLVEHRGDGGYVNHMRVTEQILSSDSTGDKSYPTMAVNLVITPGSWLAWDFNEEWIDYEDRPTETWAIQE